MAYVRRKRTFILEFDNESGDFAGLEVEATSLPTGELLELSTMASKDDMEDSEIRELLAAFARALISWNVQEEDGTPVPATIEGLLTMDLDFVMRLVSAWMKAVSPPSEGSDLGKGSTSGGSFPGEPLTMEAL